jgi:peptidoglycan hydrolase CwlO-like protein
MSVDISHNFISALTLSERVALLNEQTPAILDDFQKYYVFYNKNPEYNEYQQIFDNIKKNMDQLNTDLLSTSNNVDKNIADINEQMLHMDLLIQKVKKENNSLKRQLGTIHPQMNSSEEMILNYKSLYDIGYLKNWALFLSIIISCVTLTMVFTPAKNA